MPPRRWLVVAFCSIVCSLSTVAFAQTRVAAPSVQLVSPGGPGAPTLTSACPTFSWAPGDGVVEYELAVFELDAKKQPNSAPILHEAVSGRATSWTPAATKCLSAGREFGWYMREIGQVGEKPGPWTPALAFSVIGHTEANDARKADWDPQPAAPGGNGGGGGGAAGDGNGMTALTIQLTRIEAMLIALSNPPAVSKETCFEMGYETELGGELEAKLKGAADGDAGVWAFGNGVKANLNAAAEVKLALGAKGSGGFKRSWCWNPLIGGNRQASGLKAALTAPALSDDEFLARLATITEQLQLGDDRIGQILDELPSFAIGDDPFSTLASDSPIKRLSSVMPLPSNLRTKLSNPGQIVTNFTAQRNFCQRNNLPDVIAGVIDNFCDLAADEPFRPLLNRVDGVIDQIKGTTVGPSSALTVVRNTVNTINGTVNTISGKVQDVYDLVCSFFCSNEK